ncbi:MAG: IS110 family transposase, partial [Terriglobales bacterium]
MSRKRKTPVPEAEWVSQQPDEAGLDIGASEIWVAVPPDRDPEPVRPFSTFTPDLERLADWLAACRVTSVAMESTGVYWIPIFELLEGRGLEVYLVNARHIKNVPGRKSDVQDCQWIQRLHRYGLLNASFRPEAEMVALRAYLRQRAMLIEHRAPHIQHMQKALHQMNVQLTRVLSDITGVTGMQIVRAIVDGERDPLVLARFRQPGCRSSKDEIAQALTGHYRAEHVFALKQALTLYDTYTDQLAECDRQLAQYYSATKPRFDPDDPEHPLGPDPKPNSHSKNAPNFEVRTPLFKLVGVDLVAVSGFDESMAQTILSEIGTDMSAWPTVKHFCSWLGLAPHNDVTGGRVVRSRTLKNRNRAAQALRMAAEAAGRGHDALGAYYRHMRARVGPQQAITATAHKLARIIYHMLRDRQSFQVVTALAYDDQQHQRELKSLQRRAAQLGLTLQP